MKTKAKTMTKKMGPVVLAVDPFSDLQTSASDVLEALSPKKTELTYVMSPTSLKYYGAATKPWLQRLRTSALKAMKTREVKGPSGNNVLVNMKPSGKNDVEFLCNFAKSKKAELIVLQTHGRKGLKRMFLGSFTEAALDKSRIPLLVLSPHAKDIKKFKKVLVPIDTSAREIASFKKMIPLLKTMDLEVVLYNKVSDPIEPVVQSGVVMMGGGWVGIEQYLESDVNERRAAVDKIIEFLRAEGLTASGIVEERAGLLPELIQKAAKRTGCQLIMTGTQTGAVGAVLWGSVTRSLARESTLPLLVYPIR